LDVSPDEFDPSMHELEAQISRAAEEIAQESRSGKDAGAGEQAAGASSAPATRTEPAAQSEAVSRSEAPSRDDASARTDATKSATQARKSAERGWDEKELRRTPPPAPASPPAQARG